MPRGCSAARSFGLPGDAECLSVLTDSCTRLHGAQLSCLQVNSLHESNSAAPGSASPRRCWPRVFAAAVFGPGVLAAGVLAPGAARGGPARESAASADHPAPAAAGIMARMLELDTPHGPARAHLHPAEQARAALVLGHGAGGGVGAPDLVAATEAAVEAGVTVALVEQPYRVAGRRSPAPAKQLDAAWIAAVEQLREGELAGLTLIAGGRSLGARVACRTAAETGPAAVLCLAFPLRPPRRKASGEQAPSRLGELEAVEVPVLVVQGAQDPFGVPPAGPGREVVELRGNHGLKSDIPGVRAAVAGWLPRVVASEAHA